MNSKQNTIAGGFFEAVNKLHGVKVETAITVIDDDFVDNYRSPMLFEEEGEPITSIEFLELFD